MSGTDLLESLIFYPQVFRIGLTGKPPRHQKDAKMGDLSCPKLLVGNELDSGPVPEGHLFLFLVWEFVCAEGLYRSGCQMR